MFSPERVFTPPLEADFKVMLELFAVKVNRSEALLRDKAPVLDRLVTPLMVESRLMVTSPELHP